MTTVRLLEILVYTMLLKASLSQPSSIRIGGIFDMEGPAMAFELAVDYVNDQQLLGPSTTLTYILNTTDVIDSYESMRLVCEFARTGVMAVFGPLSSTATKAVAPITEAMHIPQVAPIATNPMLGNPSTFPDLVRFMAPDSVQSQGLIALVDHYGWNRMAILTSDTDYGINGLVGFQSEAAKRDWRIVSVLQFAVGGDTPVDAREQLLVIKNTGVRVVLLNCLAVFGAVVLSQARELGMTDAGWAWLVTDGMTGGNELLDSYEEEASSRSGLLGTRPTYNGGALFDNYRQYVENRSLPRTQHDALMTPYATYTFDSVVGFAYAMQPLVSNTSWAGLSEASINCDVEDVIPWQYGDAVLNQLQQMEGDGVSSYLQLNDNAEPLNPLFDIVNLQSDGWLSVGSWSPGEGLVISAPANVTFHGGQTVVSDYKSQLNNRTLALVTIEEQPFVMFQKEPRDRNDIQDDEIEGFCIDLLKKLSEIAGFSYRLYMVPDGNFGIKDPATRQWNGMVNELVERRADIAVADLTINYAREQDIDFTKPFMDLGMTFVMKQADPAPHRAFAFLDPLSTRVWLLILATMLLVGLHVSFISKLSPHDHHGEFIYIDQEEQEKIVKKNMFRNFKEYRKFKRIKSHQMSEMNFMNATWFSLASLLQQGGEVYPKSLSARITTVLWWLAIVILIATYTANLAAWLTKSRTQTTINSVEDLGSQTKIKYGTIASSSVWQFFLDSNVTLYSDMADYMDTYNTHSKTTAEGVSQARSGNFAFIWDSPVLDYNVEQKPCGTLQTVGRIFGQVGYGFGLQRNSPYNDELSMHILKLRESGYLDELKRKWYQEQTECADSSNQESEQDKKIQEAGGQLTVQHMLGVFYVVYGGLVLSLIILLVEWGIRCAHSVDWQGLDPLKPTSFYEAARRRIRRAWIDYQENWAPLCFRKKSKKNEDKELLDQLPLHLNSNIISSSSSLANSSANLLTCKLMTAAHLSGKAAPGYGDNLSLNNVDCSHQERWRKDEKADLCEREITYSTDNFLEDVFCVQKTYDETSLNTSSADSSSKIKTPWCESHAAESPGPSRSEIFPGTNINENNVSSINEDKRIISPQMNGIKAAQEQTSLPDTMAITSRVQKTSQQTERRKTSRSSTDSHSVSENGTAIAILPDNMSDIPMNIKLEKNNTDIGPNAKSSTQSLGIYRQNTFPEIQQNGEQGSAIIQREKTFPEYKRSPHITSAASKQDNSPCEPIVNSFIKPDSPTDYEIEGDSDGSFDESEFYVSQHSNPKPPNYPRSAKSRSPMEVT